MKVAFIKQGISTGMAGWESIRYPGPEALLRSFTLKTNIFSLLCEFQGDVWVVEGEKVFPHSFVETSRKYNPEYVPTVLRGHKGVPWAAVPWKEYDVVISLLPIIPDKIMARHSHILWCYYALAHTSKLFRKSLGAPYGAYDLFLDHALYLPSELKCLPQSVGFPYTVNPDITQELIHPTNAPAVFLDSRLMPKYQANPRWFHKKCSLPIKHSLWRPTAKRLMKGHIESPPDFLKRVGNCKYLLLARKDGYIGQGILEAAALGLIVVSGPGRYASLVCHPRCLVSAADDTRSGLAVIEDVEKDIVLQREILEYQEKVLRERFWREPLAILSEGVRLKWEIS